MYKVPYIPPPYLGRELSCEVGKGISWLCRRIYNLGKKGKGKQYQCHLPYDVEAFGQHIKWGKVVWD